MSKHTTFISLGFILVIASVFVLAQDESVVSTTAVQEASRQETATFAAAEKSYSVAVTQGETVLDAMLALQSVGDFTFTGRDYSGLGFFVDSIQGVANAGGKYWVFYVNGISATIGASSQIIRAGDLIEWKYEKSY